MKRIRQKFNELITLIDDEIKNRKKLYEKHGDRWKESYEGRECQETIEALSDDLNRLNDMVVELPEE